jgi:hypothetical protein
MRLERFTGDEKMKNLFKFVFAATVVFMLIAVVGADGFILEDPLSVSDYTYNATPYSYYDALKELKSDPTLIAACHMEFWRSRSNLTWYDGSGIHYGVKDGAGTLNCVCYYRNNTTEFIKIGTYPSYSAAFNEAYFYHNNYFNGGDREVYSVWGNQK